MVLFVTVFVFSLVFGASWVLSYHFRAIRPFIFPSIRAFCPEGVDCNGRDSVF